jgi:hypothetical protein
MAKSIIEQLEKTKKSLSAHLARGNREGGRRTVDLMDKYGDLRDAATITEWAIYCTRNGLAISHDQYDFLA